MINKLMAGLMLIVCSVLTQADTVYFLVADFDPNHRTDSYVLPLTDSNDIAHARDLIANGPGVGQPLVSAHIACGADNINRNFYSPSMNAWNWHITEFLTFADTTAELYDGEPAFINKDCLTTGTAIGTIGFWSYTVVAELGRNPKPWMADLDWDGSVNMNDWFILSMYYWYGDCHMSNDCSYSDLNHDAVVDDADVMLFAYAWLSSFANHPIWLMSWNCAYQCHGDANCQAAGGRRVTSADLAPIQALFGRLPVYCGNMLYNPDIDFDRDCDIDQTDMDIISFWLMKTGVPADCATTPF